MIKIKTASARRDRLLDLARGRAIAAGDLLRHWEARREDVQALVPPQREFDPNGAPGVDHVDRGRVVDRLEEASDIVAHRHREAARRLIVRGVCGCHGYGG